MKRAPRRTPRALSTAARSALVRLRRLCAGWDRREESLSLGHPTFRVGGAPCAVVDRYQESECRWLKAPAAERGALLATPGWFAAPYDPRRMTLCLRLDAIDWRRVHARVRISDALADAPAPRQHGGTGR